MPVPKELPIRASQQWASAQEAADEVNAYRCRFGPQHSLLACHAAFPLVVTPELVNLIHVNFLDRAHIPWLAEPDFLLSPFCRPLEDGVYQVEPSVREVLLSYLRDEGAEDIERRLADFLLAYLDRPAGRQQRPEFIRTQQWIAWSYLDPQRVVDDMTALLQENLDEQASAALLPRHLQVATMMEVVRDPLTTALPEASYRNLLETAEILAHYYYVSKDVLAAPVTQTPSVSQHSNTLLTDVSRKLQEVERETRTVAPRTFTPEQQQMVAQALAKAFPSRAALDQMLRIRLNVRLDIITGIDALAAVTNEVVLWFNQRGQVADLLRAAIEDNVQNPALHAVSAQLGLGTGRGDSDVL